MEEISVSKNTQDNKSLLTMQEYHDRFFASILLILDILKQYNYANAIKMIDAIHNEKINMEKKTSIIKKVYNSLLSNIELVKSRNEDLFYIMSNVDNQQVKLTIIPAIDIGLIWPNISEDNKVLFWQYLIYAYIHSYLMINMVEDNQDDLIKNLEPELVSGLITSNFLFDKYFSVFPDSKFIVKKEFNPFVGVGENISDYSVDDVLAGQKSLGALTYSKTSNMLELLGINKMVNMEELSHQLKNITKEQIEEATTSIKGMLGDVDNNTSDMISSMLSDISNELKGDLNTDNPLDSLVKIAEKVAHNMIPKINSNKVDIEKVWNSTKKMADNCNDKDGKPIFGGSNNPLSFLTGFMEKQMAGIKNKRANPQNMASAGQSNDGMEECQNMLKHMGLGMNMSPDQLANLDINKLVQDINKKKKRN
jgi:hypothetical protein